MEPLVLYVSTHLRLLHLGGCSMMGGNMVNDIRSACATHAPFPISGYRLAADWAGSAVIDFAYMNLVLEEGLAPGEAVRQVRSMISFAGSNESPEAAIPCADLAISEATPR